MIFEWDGISLIVAVCFDFLLSDTVSSLLWLHGFMNFECNGINLTMAGCCKCLFEWDVLNLTVAICFMFFEWDGLNLTVAACLRLYWDGPNLTVAACFWCSLSEMVSTLPWLYGLMFFWVRRTQPYCGCMFEMIVVRQSHLNLTVDVCFWWLLVRRSQPYCGYMFCETVSTLRWLHVLMLLSEIVSTFLWLHVTYASLEWDGLNLTVAVWVSTFSRETV